MIWVVLNVGHAMPLDEAVDAALARSPTAALARARADAADAGLAEVKSYMMPRASASAGLFLQNEVAFAITDALPDNPLIDTSAIEPTVVQPGQLLSVGAEISQPIVAPGVWAGKRSARSGQDLAAATGEADTRRIEQATVAAWHTSAQAHAMVAQAERAVDQSAAILEKGRALVRLGAAAADQILPFEGAVANAQANLAIARAGAEAADGVLQQLSGLDGTAGPATPPAEVPALAPLLTGLSRTDLRAADARITAAGTVADVHKATRLPMVAATGGLTLMEPAPGFADTITWRVGVVASVPLTQGGAVRAKLDAAEAQTAQARAAKALQQEAAEVEVRQAHGALVRAMAALSQQAEVVRIAGLSTAAAERRMNGGDASLLAVQRAQAEQLGAEARLTAARSEAARAADMLRLTTR